MNPEPETPRVPLSADDPYLTQLQMMAESDPELEAWLESTVFEKAPAGVEPAEPTAPGKLSPDRPA